MADIRAQVEAALASARDGILPLVPAGHPVLRQATQPFDGQIDDATLDDLVDAMHRTMRAAPGVGLAATQVGIGLRIAVMEDAADLPEDTANVRERTPVEFRTIVNARYAPVGEERRSFYEGCLSVPGYQAVVSRARTVHLAGLTAGGRAIDEELTGWPARIAAHEIDHLDGTLYLDRAELRSLAANDVVARVWNDADPSAASRALGFPVDRA